MIKEYHYEEAISFRKELINLPKKVQKKIYKEVIKDLTTCPETSDPPKIKKLKRFNLNLWRYRIHDDYRLVYQVANNTVKAMLIGHRKNIYERLGLTNEEEPTTRLIAEIPEILEPSPTTIEISTAVNKMEADNSLKEQREKLPDELTTEILLNLKISELHHNAFLAVRTSHDLLELPATYPNIDHDLEKVFDYFYPPKIEDVLNSPVKVLKSMPTDETIEFSLENYLLKLDDSQKEFVNRFNQKNKAIGPWLLKGGPGSGKSTIAMYAINALLEKEASELALEKKPLRILFTTYTKALTNASGHLLNTLSVDQSRKYVEVISIDSLAHRYLSIGFKSLDIIKQPESEECLKNIISLIQKSSTLSFSSDDFDFLLQEFENVIDGQGLKSIDEYIQVKRSGRGRPLGSKQREQIWRIYQRYTSQLSSMKKTTFIKRYRGLISNILPTYDYVFIDEAQDLKPIQIKFCLELCKDKRNIFITADNNQSIYGNGMSWTAIATDLNFKGRARNLRRNYRTTVEIWDAVKKLAPIDDETDKETLEVESFYTGPFPILARCSSRDNLKVQLNSLLRESLNSERITASSVAILCPTNNMARDFQNLLDPQFNTKYMGSHSVDLSHPGAKIMTMHAAKGLEFPIVVILGIDQWTIHKSKTSDLDKKEAIYKNQRLFFVACSRAMRKLIVFDNYQNQSHYTESATEDYWEIKDLDG